MPSEKHVTSQYKFYLTYTAKGGAKITTPEIVLNTVCGPDSTTITLPPINSPYSYLVEEVDPDLPRVELADATNSVAACPIE